MNYYYLLLLALPRSMNKLYCYCYNHCLFTHARAYTLLSYIIYSPFLLYSLLTTLFHIISYHCQSSALAHHKIDCWETFPQIHAF